MKNTLKNLEERVQIKANFVPKIDLFHFINDFTEMSSYKFTDSHFFCSQYKFNPVENIIYGHLKTRPIQSWIVNTKAVMEELDLSKTRVQNAFKSLQEKKMIQRIETTRLSPKKPKNKWITFIYDRPYTDDMKIVKATVGRDQTTTVYLQSGRIIIFKSKDPTDSRADVYVAFDQKEVIKTIQKRENNIKGKAISQSVLNKTVENKVLVEKQELPFTQTVGTNIKPSTEYSKSFEAWWNIYPRQKNKELTYLCYQKVIETGVTDDELFKYTKNYIEASKGKSLQFVKTASNFLNDKTYKSYRLPHYAYDSNTTESTQDKTPYLVEYNEWLSEYPKHFEVERAFTVYQDLRNQNVSRDELLASAIHYSKAVEGTDSIYMKHPANFLAHGTWQEFVKKSEKKQRKIQKAQSTGISMFQPEPDYPEPVNATPYIYTRDNSLNHSIRDKIENTPDLFEINLDQLVAEFYDRIDLITLVSNFRSGTKNMLLNSVLSIVSDVLSGNKPTYRISGGVYPQQMVADRLNQLRFEHITGVIESAAPIYDAGGINYLSSYLLASLYKAPVDYAVVDVPRDTSACQQPLSQFENAIAEVERAAAFLY
ncbi:MAG: hypothetical protein ACOX2M_03635 [Fastidiosipilaceae bacterium]|jgi:hypothetical protein